MSIRVVIPAFLMFVCSGTAHAQNAADTVHKISGTGDFGFVNTAGNSDVTTLNVGEEITYAPTAHLQFGQGVAIIYGKTNGAESANLWAAHVRSDRDLGNRWGAYTLVEFYRNTFAGISRRFQEGVGLLYHPIHTASDTLGAELGLGLVETRTMTDSSSTQPIGRVAGSYRHIISPNAYAEELLEILPDLQVGRNFRVNSSTSLVAPLHRNLALKASYEVIFDNDPEPGRRKADRFLTTGLHLSF